ncbi:MAG: NADAR family protein [Cyclobacteriaceae bacterium]|nr:NADAR family protein [Cyclobacteriaceae bacterium]
MKYDISSLTARFNQGEILKYIFFWGHSSKSDEAGKFVFSQWYDSPFTVEGVLYPTAEHWMMAQKAILFNEPEIFRKILLSDKPGAVKELGRQIRNFNEDKWNQEKFGIVKAGNYHKFSQSKKLKDYLVSTGDRIIVEASPVDTIWGIGLSQDAPMIENPATWRGLNLLGFALMEVRDELNNLS